MILRSGEVPRAGEGRAGGCTAAAAEAMEPGLMAHGAAEGLCCRENPSSLLAGTGKSCLENWTRRRSWENLSAGARGGRAVKPPGSQGGFLCQPSGLGLLTLWPDECVTISREIFGPDVNTLESCLKGWGGERCRNRNRRLLETGGDRAMARTAGATGQDFPAPSPLRIPRHSPSPAKRWRWEHRNAGKAFPPPTEVRAGFCPGRDFSLPSLHCLAILSSRNSQMLNNFHSSASAEK